MLDMTKLTMTSLSTYNYRTNCIVDQRLQVVLNKRLSNLYAIQGRSLANIVRNHP